VRPEERRAHLFGWRNTWAGRGAILYNTSYGGLVPGAFAAIGFANDHNLYYVNIAWESCGRARGATGAVRGTSARKERGSIPVLFFT
jgi:hypothetical protein